MKMEIVKNLISWSLEGEDFEKVVKTLEKMMENERGLYFRKIYQHLEHMYISGDRKKHSRIKNGINKFIIKSELISKSMSYKKYKCLVPPTESSLKQSREFMMDELPTIESNWIALMLGGPLGRDHEFVREMFEKNKNHLSEKQEKILKKFLISDKVGYWLNIPESENKEKKIGTSIINSSSSKRLKIAVMISGQMRGYCAAFKTWNKILSNHDVDFFISTWKLNGASGKPDHLVNQTHRFYFGEYEEPLKNILENNEKINIELVSKLIQPSKVINEDEIRRVYGERVKIKIEDESDLIFLETNAQKMYYKIGSAYSMIEDPSAYDLLVRIRPDIVIEQSNDEITDIMMLVESLPESSKSICTGYGYTYVYYGFGIDDKFAIGKPEYMKIYCETWKLNEKNKNKLVGHNSLADNLFENKIDCVGIKDMINFRFSENKHIDNKLFNKIKNSDYINSKY